MPAWLLSIGATLRYGVRTTRWSCALLCGKQPSNRQPKHVAQATTDIRSVHYGRSTA